MNNDEASKETKAQLENLEKRILFDLQRTLKDNNNNKDENKLLLTKPLKQPQDILDQPQQSKDASSLIHKLFKSEQYKTLYQSPLIDNKNDSHILHTDINVKTNPTELNDVHSLSESKKRIKDVVNIVSPLLSSSLYNVNNSTLSSNSNNSSVNLANKLKKLLQSKTNESDSKLNVNGRNKDNTGNDRDRGENGCGSKDDNVLSETIHNDNKQCSDLFKSKFHSKMNTSSDIFKLSLIPLSNDSTSANNNNNSKPSLGHSSQKSSPLDTDVHALFNNIHQQQQHKASTTSSTTTTTTVKNILELIKQKKPQSNQLQRSFECEQQPSVPPPNQSLSNIKQLFLNKEPHQLKPEEEQRIRERVRKEQEHKLKLEAEKRRKALEDEHRIKQEHESQAYQQQQQPQIQHEQPTQEEQTAVKDENDRKQREVTRKLLLEELRKEVTKEITESVKKEFEEKVKKQQERLEEKEKVIIEREKEANDKLHQSQSQLDNTQTTDDEDKRVKQTLFKNASINSNQPQQQLFSINTDEQSFTSSINANLIRKPYHKKQNHVIIYSKKPGLRGRSAEKAQNKNFSLNTNTNTSLNNTYLYCNNNINTQHYVQKSYNNGVINNYQYIEQYNYNTFNTNSNNNVYTNYNTTTNTYRYDYDMNPLSTNTMTSSSRYLHTSPTTHMNINIVDSNDSGTNNNNTSTYNTYVHPYQYTAPPSSIYNLYQPPPSLQSTNMYRPSSPQQYDCLSINFEDLLLFEQKLMDIYRDFTYNKPMTNECFEWWNYYFNCSLFKQLEKTFKNEIARFIVQESIYYQLLSIIICYDVSSKQFVYEQVKVMIKPILIYNHHNLILIYQYILSKVPKESMNNIWVKKLSNLIYAVKSSSRNEMNPDTLFMNSPHVYNVNFTEVDKIEFITRSIINNIRILLKNYPPGNTTDILVTLFKTLKHKTYEEINDIFLSKILRVDNPNGSVLASVLIRENAYFSTVEAPYLKNPSVRPFTLVLDLDETIIHFKINEQNETEGVLQVRPGIQEFLTTIGQFYEIVIFTAATQDYADLLIEELEENTFYFDYKLYRQHTIIIGNNFVKDLTRLGRPLDKVIIVDNMPQNFRLQKENGIHIRPFWGDDAQDTALIELQPILVNIAKEGGDVRKGLRKYKDEIMNKVTMNQTNRC